MARWSLERLATIGLRRSDAEWLSRCWVSDGDLRGEQDAVCPRCLKWIEDWESVRRTAFGPLQHELCPGAG